MQKQLIKERLKGVAVGAILATVLMSVTPVFARAVHETITVTFNNINIAVNGRQVQTEFEPFIFQGRTYLPVRDVAAIMGYEATWEDATNTVHLTSRDISIAPDYPAHQPAPPAVQTPQPPAPQPQPPTAHAPHTRNNRPTNPAISLDRAIEIAYEYLASQGINATYRSNSGMDWERSQWVWELLFRTQGERMPLIEFYINVDSGEIVKFEWDD